MYSNLESCPDDCICIIFDRDISCDARNHRVYFYFIPLFPSFSFDTRYLERNQKHDRNAKIAVGYISNLNEPFIIAAVER